MLTLLSAWFTSHLQALRTQNAKNPELGASTVEWVIILVCVIAVAVLVAALVTNVVNDRSTGIF